MASIVYSCSSPLDTFPLRSASSVNLIAGHRASEPAPAAVRFDSAPIPPQVHVVPKGRFLLGMGLHFPARRQPLCISQVLPWSLHLRTPRVSRTSPYSRLSALRIRARSNLVPQSFLRTWMRLSLKRPGRAVSFGLPRLLSRTARSSGVPPTFRPLVSRAQLRLTA
jgi:hypothetical protein